MPDNIWYAFWEPSKINVDDLGRLSEKALKRFYQPGLGLTKAWSYVFNPRRAEGVDKLRALDVDSHTYIEPILYHADKITLDLLEPIFSKKGKETHVDAALGFSSRLQELSKLFERKGPTPENQDAFNEIMGGLNDAQTGMRDDLQKLSKAFDEVLKQIDNISFNVDGKSLKRTRVEALRNHMLRIQKQAVDLYRDMENTTQRLQDLGSSTDYTTREIAAKIQEIGSGLESRVKTTKKLALDLADMSFTRQNRKIRTRVDGNVIDESGNASVEHYRRLKLAIDMCFVPEFPQSLGIIESKSLVDNHENYFIMAVEYALSNAFDKDGKFIPTGSRAVRYGEDLSQYIAQMYVGGKPEDALYAISLLKMMEGRESYSVFAHGFQDMVKKQMASLYGMSEASIQSDKHANHFLERVREISAERDHSPMVFGARDTKKRYVMAMKDYIYGRMYPGSDGFIATPLNNDLIRKPIIQKRAEIISYFTGGRLVPITDLGRKPNESNALENELKLGIQRNWFWWSPKQEKTKENPKPLGFMNRAPVWFSAPTRVTFLAAMPAAVVVASGGLALPAVAAWPVMALGVASAANYGWKTTKVAWALPFVHKPVMVALKTTAMVAGTIGAGIVLLPLAPAAAGMAVSFAMAAPVTAAVFAAPVAAVGLWAGFKGVKHVKAVMKAREEGATANENFGAYRQNTKIVDDPYKLTKDGVFLPSAERPQSVVIVAKEAKDNKSADPNNNPGTPADLSQQFAALLAGIEKIADARGQAPQVDSAADLLKQFAQSQAALLAGIKEIAEAARGQTPVKPSVSSSFGVSAVQSSGEFKPQQHPVVESATYRIADDKVIDLKPYIGSVNSRPKRQEEREKKPKEKTKDDPSPEI